MLGNKPSLNTFKKLGFAKYVLQTQCSKIRNQQKENGKFINIWKLTFLSNLWVKEEITKEVRKYLEMNESKNTVSQNLGDTAKGVFTRKFIVVNFYIKNQEKSQ